MASVFQYLTELCRARTDCLALIGAIASLYIALRATCSLWRGFKEFILAPTLGLGIDVKTLGTWAVVTGSTDGIGKAYAEALAKAGLKIVLVSRSVDKLRNVAKEIEDQYKVETKIIAVDFTGGREIYDEISKQLSGLDIAVLVNNVGMSYEFPKYLLEAGDQELSNIITVNCNSVTFMTRIVLPAMVEKRKGAIINISSMSGTKTAPFLTVYAASKAFVEFFSSGIREEYKSKGIVVQNVSPGFVATKMSGIRNASFIAPDPTRYVRSALATLGVVSETFGCSAHALMALVVAALPNFVYFYLSNSTLLSSRARALKKRTKKQ